MLTTAEITELENNGMGIGTVGRFYYDEMRKSGVSHRDSIRNFIDGINNMKSTSFAADQMKSLKEIIHKVKGKMD